VAEQMSQYICSKCRTDIDDKKDECAFCTGDLSDEE
jgi:DNA-directed RNA polymerase subunit RPC12/RpoP